jgi:hypothetical protein
VCKNQGHKASVCSRKNNGGGGSHKVNGKQNGGKKKFMGTCNNCVKFGHMKNDCWAINANKSKSPSRYQRNDRTGNS